MSAHLFPYRSRPSIEDEIRRLERAIARRLWVWRAKRFVSDHALEIAFAALFLLMLAAI